MDYPNIKNKIIIFTAFLLIIIFSFVLYNNIDFNTNNIILRNIWLNMWSNQLEWQYSNDDIITGPSPLNRYKPIYLQQNMILNNGNIFSIGQKNELILAGQFDNTLNRDSMTCWKVIDLELNKLCLTNNGDVYSFHQDAQETIFTGLNKNGYLLRDIIFDSGKQIILYEKIFNDAPSNYDPEVIPIDPRTLIKDDNKTKLSYIIKINDKEIILNDILVYSIIAGENGFILNTQTSEDWSDHVKNYSIYKLGLQGELSLLYKNTPGIIIYQAIP